MAIINIIVADLFPGIVGQYNNNQAGRSIWSCFSLFSINPCHLKTCSKGPRLHHLHSAPANTGNMDRWTCVNYGGMTLNNISHHYLTVWPETSPHISCPPTTAEKTQAHTQHRRHMLEGRLRIKKKLEPRPLFLGRAQGRQWEIPIASSYWGAMATPLHDINRLGHQR